MFFITAVTLQTYGAESDIVHDVDTTQNQTSLSKIRLAATMQASVTPSSFQKDWQVNFSEDCKDFSNEGKNIRACNYRPTTQSVDPISLQFLKTTTVADITVSSAQWEIDRKSVCIDREQMAVAFHSHILRARNPSADAALGGVQPDHEYGAYELPIQTNRRGETYITVNEFDKCAAQIILYKTESI
jgi:hypothetical protein